MQFAGIVPIPGAKTVSQVKDHVDALTWNLEENEYEMINEKLNSL